MGILNKAVPSGGRLLTKICKEAFQRLLRGLGFRCKGLGFRV